MARGWKCARCSNENGEGTLNCSNCGLIRGGVVVPSSYVPPPTPPSVAPAPSNEPWSPMPAPGWNSGSGQAPAETPATPSPAPVTPAEPDATAWAAPPTSTPLWRRLPIGGIFVLLLIVAGGVGGLIFNASRSETGEIVKEGDLTAIDLRVGDCFDLKDPSADLIEDVKAVPCTAEHEYEMVFTGSLAEGTYPSDDAFTAFFPRQLHPGVRHLRRQGLPGLGAGHLLAHADQRRLGPGRPVDPVRGLPPADQPPDRDPAGLEPVGKRALGAGAATLDACPTNSSTRPTSSPGTTRPTRRSSRTSRSRSTRAPRSASSVRTAPASRACCGSWPGSTTGSPARPA